MFFRRFFFDKLKLFRNFFRKQTIIVTMRDFIINLEFETMMRVSLRLESLIKVARLPSKISARIGPVSV